MQRKEAKLKIFERIGFAHWLMKKLRIPECTILFLENVLLNVLEALTKEYKVLSTKDPKIQCSFKYV